MRAVPRDRSPLIAVLALLATAAVAIAGCDAGGSTQRPTPAPTVAPSPSPSPTTLPQATPVATPVPTAGCPAEGFESAAALSVLTAQGFLTLDLLPGAMPTPVVVDESIIPSEAILVGGVELTARLQADVGGDDATFSSVTADFLPFGATTPLQLAATIDGSAITVRLLDQALKGQLRIAVAWSTRCGTGDGAGAVGITIVDSSAVAGCPATEAGLAGLVDALQAARITIGTRQFAINITGWSGRWMSASDIDDFAAFDGWDRDVSIAVAPEANVTVREAVDDLGILSVQASIFRRAEVIAYLEPDSNGNLQSVKVTTRPVNINGRVNIPAPLEPGSYVFELESSWQTSCLTLDTYHVVTVEVQ
jgi:hypothetical protein